MEHADRFLRRFYIEKCMFGSLSVTFIFYRPPLLPSTWLFGSRPGFGIFVLVCPAGWRWRVADARVGAHELHPGQVQPGPGSGVERSKEKEKITAGIGA